MKNTIYSFFVRAFITVSCLSSFAGAHAPEQAAVATSSVIAQEPTLDALKQAQQFVPGTETIEQSATSADSLLNPVFKVFYAAIKNIKNLNYYTAKGIVLPLPGTSQEVVFNWGFKGSGNIFTPLPNIKAQVRPALLQALQQENPTALKGVGYAILQNELFKYTKTTTIAKWLTQANLNPATLFGLKLILLIKTTLESPQAHSNMYAELMRLLFRLNLSEEFHVLNQQQPLSSFIPAELRHAAEIQIPGCMEFIDELWEQLTSATPQTRGTKCYAITCFAFRDQDFAAKMDQRLRNYKDSRLINYATQLINLNNHQVVNVHDFAKFPHSQELVGFLYTTHPGHKNLPMTIKTAIETATEFPTTKLITTENGEQWLCHVSDKLGTIDTIKAVILSFARTLHDYVALKKELFSSQTPEALTYRKQWEEQERKAEIIQNFLETEDGAASLARLSQEVTATMQPTKAQTTATQKRNTLKDEYTQTIQNLEKQCDALASNIELCEIVKKTCKGKDLTTIQGRIRDLKKQHETILSSIKQTQEKLDALTVEATPEVQLEQDQKNLDDLMVLVLQQQNQGQVPSEQLLTTIANLQTKIKLAATGKPQQIDLDQRLEKRDRVAKIFLTEATIMEKQLNEKNTTIQQITNEAQRTIQELLFGKTQEEYKTYIQNLRQEAQRISDQNQKAHELKRYKKALSVVGVTLTTKDQQEKMQNLEEHVGHLFAATQEENFIETVFGSRPEFKEFLADLQSDQAAFKNIKATLIETLTNILKSSAHVQDNIILYQYLIRTFVPELFPMLSSLATTIA